VSTNNLFNQAFADFSEMGHDKYCIFWLSKKAAWQSGKRDGPLLLFILFNHK
jgi:hypothetical protein